MVEIYDDRVSIVSPGGVPKGITKENFGKRSIARNPIIADLLRRAHYIEKAGTGIGRMRELMEDAGLKIVHPIKQVAASAEKSLSGLTQASSCLHRKVQSPDERRNIILIFDHN